METKRGEKWEKEIEVEERKKSRGHKSASKPAEKEKKPINHNKQELLVRKSLESTWNMVI